MGRTIPAIISPMKSEKMPAREPSGLESEMYAMLTAPKVGAPPRRPSTTGPCLVSESSRSARAQEEREEHERSETRSSTHQNQQPEREHAWPSRNEQKDKITANQSLLWSDPPLVSISRKPSRARLTRTPNPPSRNASPSSFPPDRSLLPTNLSSTKPNLLPEY